MSKRIKKIIATCMLGILMVQASPMVYANNTAICAVKVNNEEQKEVKETQDDQLNKAFIKAKDTLKKQVTIKVEQVNEEQMNAYIIPGQLVPYIRSVILKKVDNKTIQAEIDYTTWYQASKAHKEPKLYQDKISDTAKQTLKEAKRVIKELKLENETSAYVKEKAIHDYIIGKAKYSSELSPDVRHSMHGAEGVLLNQDGMCRSYTESMQLFMEMLGVESKMIMGTSKKDYAKHVWNMVKLDDGEWYYVDLTWNESSKDEPGKVLYDYFNVPYRIISSDHIFEEWQQLEVADSLTYFPYKSIVAYSSDDVIDIVKGQLLQKHKEGEVYISYMTDVNEVMPLVIQAMKDTKVYGKIQLDKKTDKIYYFKITD